MDAEDPNFTLKASNTKEEVQSCIEFVRHHGAWQTRYGGSSGPKKMVKLTKRSKSKSKTKKKKTDEEEEGEEGEEDDGVNTSDLAAVDQDKLDFVALLSTSISHFLEQMLRLKKQDKVLLQEIAWVMTSEDNKPLDGDPPDMAAAKAEVKRGVDDRLDERYDRASRAAFRKKVDEKRVEVGGWTKAMTMLEKEQSDKQVLINIGLMKSPVDEAREKLEAEESYNLLLPYIRGTKEFPQQIYKWTTVDEQEEIFGGFAGPPKPKVDGAGPSVVVGTASMARN